MNESNASIDTLIIGFGLTSIPLIRELEQSEHDYMVISSGSNIWEQLDRADRLDFDLVSSYMSSVYSFELIASRQTVSQYPTAREFHDFITKYKHQYASKVTDDWVTVIENYESHSVVHTRSGKTFQARNLVVATAFRRRIDDALFDFDFDRTENKTIVITHMGDSANLIVSKLVPRNNRIILLNNGFFCLDKMITHNGVSYALDDVEMHNVSHLSGYLYKMALPQGQLVAASMPKISKIFLGSNFLIKHPMASRNLDLTPSLDITRGSPFTPTIPNGIKIVKYWPIDVYEELFGASLRETIEQGFLLNDITFFIDQGLVEIWPHEEAFLDRDNSVVKWREEVVPFDHIIEGDQEVPNLPKIIIKRGGQPERNYQYFHRDCFMGIVPRDLENTYFLGYTRPLTGGLNNITEMQCLFAHKMITDDDFRQSTRLDLNSKIDAYNKERHVSRVRAGSDNLVFYGQYTEQLARLMGIQPRLSDCHSLEDLSIYLFFPNAPCKYRQEGPYKIEGMTELVREIHRVHQGYAISKLQLLNFCLTLVTTVMALVLVYFTQVIPLPLSVLLMLLAIVFLSPVLSLVNANSNRIAGYMNIIMALGLGLTAYFRHPLIPVASLACNFLAVYICRKKGITRVWFNDMIHKDRYRNFYARYQRIFNEVFGYREDES